MAANKVIQYTYINFRSLPGSGTAVLYRNSEGGYTVTVFKDSPSGVSYDFEFRSKAVLFREQLRKS